jgi:hypothetical protein
MPAQTTQPSHICRHTATVRNCLTVKQVCGESVLRLLTPQHRQSPAGALCGEPRGLAPAGLASGLRYGARMYCTELAGMRVRVSVVPALGKCISETVMYEPETLVTHAT